VVVDIVLPAVLGLVLVREAGIKASSNELEGLGLAFLAVRHICGRGSRRVECLEENQLVKS